MNIYVVRADFGRYTDVFKQNGYVGIGWLQEPLSDPKNREELVVLYEKTYPQDNPNRKGQNIGQIYRFLNDIKIGDIVITPYNNQELLVGEVVSDYYYKNDSTSPYPCRKDVKWQKETINRTLFSIPVQNTLRSSLTIFSVSQVHEVLAIVNNEVQLDKAIDNKIVYDAKGLYTHIKEKFLQLGATEFETLVSYLLQSLGFEAKQRTGSVGDGGIDFEGELNVMGIASVNLQVQVKRYEGAVIGEKEIRSFRGALKRDYQGTFITLSGFNKKAIESANDESKVLVKLINGNQFVDIFIEQYEKIMDAMLEDGSDELASKLKFKKALLAI